MCGEDEVPAGEQRRNPANLHEDIVASMLPRTVVTVYGVRCFARRARGCRRLYLASEDGERVRPKEVLERIGKKCEAHRDVLDMGPGFGDGIKLQDEEDYSPGLRGVCCSRIARARSSAS